jgi:hypothetical protein
MNREARARFGRPAAGRALNRFITRSKMRDIEYEITR